MGIDIRDFMVTGEKNLKLEKFPTSLKLDSELRPEYEQRLAASSAGEGDVVVIVSFGGRGFVAPSAAELLSRRGVPVVLVASAGITPLDRFATVKLALSPQEDHVRKVSPFATGMSLLFVLDALFARVFVEDYDANLARRLSYYEGIVAMGGCTGGR